MRDLWVVRHGHTADTDAGLLNSDPSRQTPLDAAGREQAAALSDVLAAEPIEVCLVSEYVRTAETADLALAGRGIERRVVPELNEVLCGDHFEGRAHDDYRDWCLEHGMFAVPPGAGGVPLADTLLRVHDAWRAVLERAEQVGLIVTHGFLVGFALRMVDMAPGRPMLPFPAALPGRPVRLDGAALSSGLTEVHGRVIAVARDEEAGRRWSRARGFRIEAPTDGEMGTG